MSSSNGEEAFLQLMSDYGMTEEHYNKQVTNIHLEELSRSGCKLWKSLPPHLELKTIVAEDIDDCREDPGMKRYKFLLKWKDMKGLGATYRQLINALLKIECRQDAEKLCDMLKKSTLTVDTSSHQITTAGTSSKQVPVATADASSRHASQLVATADASSRHASQLPVATADASSRHASQLVATADGSSRHASQLPVATADASSRHANQLVATADGSSCHASQLPVATADGSSRHASQLPVATANGSSRHAGQLPVETADASSHHAGQLPIVSVDTLSHHAGQLPIMSVDNLSHHAGRLSIATAIASSDNPEAKSFNEEDNAVHKSNEMLFSNGQSDPDSSKSASEPLDLVVQEELEFQLTHLRDKIINQYAQFVHRLCVIVKDKTNIDDFRTFLLRLPALASGLSKQHGGTGLLEDVKEKLDEAKSLNKIFDLLGDKCASFLNYGIFESIREEYCSDIDCPKLRYSDLLKEHIEKHNIKDFFAINPQLEKLTDETKTIRLKLDIDLTSKVTRLINIKHTLAAILGVTPRTLQLISVKRGCVVVTFLIQASVGGVVFADNMISPKQVQDIRALPALWMEYDGHRWNFTEIEETFPPEIKMKETSSPKEASPPKFRCSHVPYNYVHEPDDGLKCVICLDVAKDPLQHLECGRLFCRECIVKYGKEKPCAHCRTQGSEFYPDKKSRRDIQGLPVKCAHVESGCEWTGTAETLQKHLSMCNFSQKVPNCGMVASSQSPPTVPLSQPHQELTQKDLAFQEKRLDKVSLELTWVRGPNVPFAMTNYAQSVTVHGKLYMGGGVAAGKRSNNFIVNYYDITSERWGDLPKYEAQYFAMTAINKQLVLVGGAKGNGGGGAIKKLGVWGADHKQWTYPYPDMLEARYGCSAIVHNEWLVVAGGMAEMKTVTSVEVLDTAADNMRWLAGPPTPRPFYCMKTAVVGDMGYFMGGTDDSHSSFITSVHQVCIRTLIKHVTSKASSGAAWKEIRTLQLTGTSPLSFNGSLLAMGGWDECRNAVTDIHLYQPDTGEWVKVGDLPFPRYYSTCAMMTHNKILVARGEDNRFYGLKRMDFAVLS